MERRFTARRAHVDFPVTALVDGFRHPCRAVDLSTTGMIVQRSRHLAGREPSMVGAFELHLGGRRPIRARTRSVWEKDGLEAVRFVVMNDADRLAIAELLDELVRQRQALH